MGAAVVVGVPEPWISVRADLPADLRAHLWGFCLAVALAVRDGSVTPHRAGLLYVGLERRPVTGPGVALLGALILQRCGKPSPPRDFPVHHVYTWPTEQGEHLGRVA